MAPILRVSTKAVALPSCTLHHDAGAPPCPSCTTPHARTCAPWEGVEAHEYDCVCPWCREAWLLSDSESEDQFGVPMRSRNDEEWEPSWSQEILKQELPRLEDWHPECWFRVDQREQAHSATPSSLPTPALDLAHHTTPPHRSSRSPRRRHTSRITKRLASRYALGGCIHVHAHTARTHYTTCTCTRAGTPHTTSSTQR